MDQSSVGVANRELQNTVVDSEPRSDLVVGWTIRHLRAKFKLSQHPMGNCCTFSNESGDVIRTVPPERESQRAGEMLSS